MKLRKGKGFETIEEYMDIGNIDIPYKSCALLEDLPNLVANNMFTKIHKRYKYVYCKWNSTVV